MLLGRQHELWARGSRFAVRRRSETSGGDGRILSGHEAERILVELLSPLDDPAQVRTLYAQLSGSFDVHRVADVEVLRWLSRELGIGVLGRASSALVLVEVGRRLLSDCMAAKAATDGSSPASESQKLVLAIDAQLGGKDLVYRGESYRLAVVVAFEHGQAPSHDSYERLPVRESQQVLTAIAQAPACAAALRDLLGKALALSAAGLERPTQEQLLLLRRARPIVHVARTPAPNVRPVTKPAIKPRRSDYIEIELFTSSGASMHGVRLELTTPDKRMTTLATDEHGGTGLTAIDPGSCHVALPKFDLSASKAASSAKRRAREKSG